jgi:hypothetical protein
MNDVINLDLLLNQGSPNMAEFEKAKLGRQLYLYQSFLKIYEQHSSLLDEILQLENLRQSSSGIKNELYIAGTINGSAICLMTNLYENQTLTFNQQQYIWTLGRDRTNGICIDNPYLSRRHAIIRFSEDDQSFSLQDLNSSNGSFINGERIIKPTKLQEGDRIRLGTLMFSFYLNTTTKFLPDVTVELLTESTAEDDVQVFAYSSSKTRILDEQADDTIDVLRSTGLMREESFDTSLSKLIDFESHQNSEIVDYFLGKTKSDSLASKKN